MIGRTIRAFKRRLSKKIKLNYYFNIPYGRKIIIPGTPTHSNLGDSAIVLAQIIFLKKLGIKNERIKEVTFREYYEYRKILKKCIKKDDLIVSLGGGNMGNQWKGEEVFRYDLLNDFKENPIIIFPQTIHFVDTENVEQEKRESVEHYESQNKLTMIAREQKSYETMKNLYKNTNILLAPDIVLSTKKEDYDVVSGERKGVLFCIRNDVEKSISNDDWEILKKKVKENGLEYRDTDMHAEESVTKENRQELVKKKMQEFCDAKLVVTDRLHGMIFAAITETPCIVFSNYNHKVKGTYEWINSLPYIRFAENVSQALSYIPELLNISSEECKYDNENLNQYYKQIQDEVENNSWR